MLLVAGLAPLMGISAFFVGRRVRASSRARREIESSMQAHVQQTLSGIQVVQAFAQEERQLGHFRDFAMAAIRTRQWPGDSYCRPWPAPGWRASDPDAQRSLTP